MLVTCLVFFFCATLIKSNITVVHTCNMLISVQMCEESGPTDQFLRRPNCSFPCTEDEDEIT